LALTGGANQKIPHSYPGTTPAVPPAVPPHTRPGMSPGGFSFMEPIQGSLLLTAARGHLSGLGIGSAELLIGEPVFANARVILRGGLLAFVGVGIVSLAWNSHLHTSFAGNS
jgi:hypothetical protein